MARQECKNGHIYDTSIYSSCPYCESRQTVLEFNATEGPSGGHSVLDDDRTMPISNKGASFSSEDVTEAPPEYRRRRVGDDDPTQKPRGYRERRVTDEDNHTVATLNRKLGVEAPPDMTTPIVGWLVCIEGPEYGRDYRVYGQRNTVGRNDNMDISIKKDMAITGDTHLWLGYDHKYNTFRLTPGNASNYTYVNEQPLDIPVTLHIYDLIEMGESKFLFIPLCGERFDWTNGLKSMNGGTNGMA